MIYWFVYHQSQVVKYKEPVKKQKVEKLKLVEVDKLKE